MDDERKVSILKIIRDIHTRGLDNVDPECSANDVIISLFNIIILAVSRTGNTDDIDMSVKIFEEMVQAYKADTAEKTDET